MSTPYEKLYDLSSSTASSNSISRKRDCISQLVYRMCEDNAADVLMKFAGMADEVEGTLAFEAQNVDRLIQPSYSRIIYTWFIQRPSSGG